MSEFRYEIKRKYGVISESSNGWTKEFNYVSWNERSPKYDLRDWDPQHKRMGKGITLTKTEALKLQRILANINFSDSDAPVNRMTVNSMTSANNMTTADSMMVADNMVSTENMTAADNFTTTESLTFGF